LLSKGSAGRSNSRLGVVRRQATWRRQGAALLSIVSICAIRRSISKGGKKSPAPSVKVRPGRKPQRTDRLNRDCRPKPVSARPIRVPAGDANRTHSKYRGEMSTEDGEHVRPLLPRIRVMARRTAWAISYRIEIASVLSASFRLAPLTLRSRR